MVSHPQRQQRVWTDNESKREAEELRARINLQKHLNLSHNIFHTVKTQLLSTFAREQYVARFQLAVSLCACRLLLFFQIKEIFFLCLTSHLKFISCNTLWGFRFPSATSPLVTLTFQKELRKARKSLSYNSY